MERRAKFAVLFITCSPVMCLDATYEKLQASQLAVYPVYERAFPVYENMGAQFDRRH